MKIIECRQMSPEWWEHRRGLPTASEFGRILTPKKLELASAADDYIDELIAERFSPATPGPQYTSRAAQNGVDTEPEARRWYEFQEGVKVSQVGLITTDDGRFGCSPDGLITQADETMPADCRFEPSDPSLSIWGKALGGLELKCPQPKTHVRWLRQGGVPADHLCQVHGGLIVTGLAWWDFLSYCPGFPPLLVRTEPNAFTAKLRSVLDVFHEMYMSRLKQFTGDDTADTFRLAIADVEGRK